MKNTATLIKSNLEGFNGTASLYKCEPPHEGHCFVVASSVNAPFSGPETYLFPANEKGEVQDWGELAGSMRGDWDHSKVFRIAGYELVE